MYCIMSHVSGYLAGHRGEKQQTHSFAARHVSWRANSRGKVLTESLTLNMVMRALYARIIMSCSLRHMLRSYIRVGCELRTVAQGC